MMEHIASPLLRFLSDECKTGPKYKEPLEFLHGRYKTWCEANGHKPMSTPRFQQALISAAPDVEVRKLGPRGQQRRMCLGVGLRSGSVKPTEATKPEAEGNVVKFRSVASA